MCWKLPSGPKITILGPSSLPLLHTWNLMTVWGRFYNLYSGPGAHPTRPPSPDYWNCIYLGLIQCKTLLLSPSDTIHLPKWNYQAILVHPETRDLGPTLGYLSTTLVHHLTDPSATPIANSDDNLSLALSPLGLSPTSAAIIGSESSSLPSDPLSSLWHPTHITYWNDFGNTLSPPMLSASSVPFTQASTLTDTGDSGDPLSPPVLSAPTPIPIQYAIAPSSANCLVVAVGNHGTVRGQISNPLATSVARGHTVPYTTSACAVGGGHNPHPTATVASTSVHEETTSACVVGTGHNPHPPATVAPTVLADPFTTSACAVGTGYNPQPIATAAYSSVGGVLGTGNDAPPPTATMSTPSVLSAPTPPTSQDYATLPYTASCLVVVDGDRHTTAL